MRQNDLNIAFFITTGISILVFIYLVFLGYDEIQSFKDVIKIIASVVFPIPVLFFVRLIAIENFMPENTDEYKIKNQKPAILLLLVTIIAAIVIINILELVTHKKLEETLILAHLINSSVISSYVFNFLLYNNLKVNGVLSGILLALALQMFFLSS